MPSTLLPDLEATLAYGRALGEGARPGLVIGLVGTLGAGKTTMAGAVVEGAGAEGPVTSPTFTLVHRYEGGRLPVFHLDFYRLESADELPGIGWDDILDEGGLTIVEWADRFPEALPPDALWVEISAPTHGLRSVWSGFRDAWIAQRDAWLAEQDGGGQ